MKRCAIFFSFLCVLALFAGSARSDPLSDLMEDFSKEYDATKPPTPYSSVNSDYTLKQTALGSIYTTRTLGLLYRQNQQLMEKYDEMLQKYDQIIEQNKQIIELLSVLAKGKEKGKGRPEYGAQTAP
ncbi:MAG: hypothetical protein JRI80_04280 [Deltaproteobacteria bacterium]|nr:hypothetical protein [Deltaproteobacteria bacterium]